MIWPFPASIGLPTFDRGIHPPAHKELSADSAIEVLPTPASVHVPLWQHTGAPCEAVVKPRQVVTYGDVIGDCDAVVSAPIHASVAGKVRRVSAVTLANGRRVSAVRIESTGEQLAGAALAHEIFGGAWPTVGLEAYAPEAVSAAVRTAGVVGMGGAAFPTHIKLVANPDRPVDTLIVNGCECEPYLTADHRLMVEYPGPIVTGALLAAGAVNAGAVLVAIESNKPAAIEALRQATEGTAVGVVEVETKYPMGGERQLIPAVLGREVPTGGLPMDVGAAVINVATAAAIARAVLREGALTHRVVSVGGAGIRNPKNLLVPIGAAIVDLIEHCDGVTEDAARIVVGGPMMGFTLPDEQTPVTKGTSGVTVLTRNDMRCAEETECIRCGRCVDVCPLHLVPTKIALAARRGAWEVADRLHMNACCECGCCAYECPAGIPLVQLIRMGKTFRTHNETTTR